MVETDRLIAYDVPAPKPERPKTKKDYYQSLYKSEYDEIASRLSAVGFSCSDLAHTLGVPKEAIENWKIHFPTFKTIWRNGKKDQLRRMVGKALLEAVGYDYKTSKTEVSKDAEGNVKGTKEMVFTNHQSPQPNLLIFLLCNLSSQLGLGNEDAWKSRQKLEIESKSINLTITGELVSEQITKLAGKLLGEPERKPLVIDATFEPTAPPDSPLDAQSEPQCMIDPQDEPQFPQDGP